MSVPPREAIPIVMFHPGRSGSTVLCDLLGRHPDVTWDKEPFLFTRKKGRSHPLLRPRPIRWLLSWLPPEDPLAYIEARRRRVSTRYHGIDVKPFHLARRRLSFEQFLTLMEAEADAPPRYVVLTRRNMLRKIVSSLVMRRTGKTHLRRSSSDRSPGVRIDVGGLQLDGQTLSLVAFLTQWDRTFRELDACLVGRDPLRLTYEDDLEADPTVGYGRVCGHLGLEPVPLEVRFARTTPHPPSALIENVAEVREALAGTPHEWMLDS